VNFQQIDLLDVPIKCHYGIIDIQNTITQTDFYQMVSGASKQLKVEKTSVR
jgi:hypothetical protein